MKKYYFIFGLLFLIIIVTIVGNIILSGNIEVEKTKDILSYQEELETNFKHYGYTIDNPNVIINPYEISPLTALVIFETETKETPSITIKGKDNEEDFTYSLKEGTIHYLPIYYLYANYDNEIIISFNNYSKTINIKTDDINIDVENYPHYIDNNGNVRWYLTNKYQGKITKLENNHYLMSNDKLNNEENHTGIIEIDLLGKIYMEYLLKGGYFGLNTIKDDNILVLSKTLLEIDATTGKIIGEYLIDSNYDYLTYQDNKIILQNKEKTIAIEENNEITEIATIEEKEFELATSNFKIIKSIRYGNLEETKTINKNISLLKYESYQNDIDIIKEYNRLVIKIDSNEDTYIILDKFLDKRIYEVKNNVLYINDTNLKGKYTIYLKIKDKVYKTNYFVKY